jgi:geranylgeranyl diphosphate synthase type II
MAFADEKKRMNTSLPTFSLDHYRLLIEAEINRTISFLGPSSPLRDACEYALTNGGKRYRPIIAFLVAEALGLNAPVMPAALGVEFFHTASLVADDLPCMDDDDLRRDLPATHRQHGEATALLVSYALIAAGYESLAKNTALLKAGGLPHSELGDQICVIALENATYNTGLWGATGGQFIDLFPPNLELETLRNVIHKKTVSLFEVAFVFGWAYGGGALELLPKVKQLASHYGMAFQIADDLDDIKQDASNGHSVNLAAVVGMEKAVKMFHEEIHSYALMLKELGVATPQLLFLAETLKEKVAELQKTTP